MGFNSAFKGLKTRVLEHQARGHEATDGGFKRHLAKQTWLRYTTQPVPLTRFRKTIKYATACFLIYEYTIENSFNALHLCLLIILHHTASYWCTMLSAQSVLYPVSWDCLTYHTDVPWHQPTVYCIQYRETLTYHTDVPWHQSTVYCIQYRETV